MTEQLTFNQRWSAGRASYRPPEERIRTSEYDIAEIPDDNTARGFVETHPYSRSYPGRPLPLRPVPPISPRRRWRVQPPVQ